MTMGIRIALGVGLGITTIVSSATAQKPNYPATQRGDVVEDYHGTRIADPYRWLEDTDAAATGRWVESQNAVSFSYLSSMPQREAIEERLTELWNFERYGVPFRRGGRYFYTYNTGLQNQNVLYTQPDLTSEARVLLDPNTLSEDGTVALTTLVPSPDGRLLGYGIAASGSDWQEFRVRDVATGNDLPDRIEFVKFSGLSWTKDGAGFFYSRYPEPARDGDRLLAENKNQMLYYHRIGTPQSDDVLVYADPAHPDWFANGITTEDGRYLLIYIGKGSDSKTKLYVLDLVDPHAPQLGTAPMRVVDHFDDAYNVIGSDGPVLYAVTDRDAPRQRIVAIDVREPAPSAWRTIVPETGDAIQGGGLIGGRLVVEYLQDAKSRVVIHELDGRRVGDLPLEGVGSLGGLSGEPDRSELFYAFTSFLTPTTIYRYDLATGENTVFRTPDVDFDASRYETKQVFVTSKDGTRLPMFIVHRKDIALDGSNPAYLYGYGGFNISLTPAFSIANLVWLEQGGVYAQPSLRGGGEYGEEWHQAGTKERKQNVFDDFIASAEYLIENGYTAPARLAIGGGSNGGLLVGAAMTQRPELFGVALPAVGVMDMLRFHKFTIGWAWTTDYGSADNPEDFEYLRAYSPLHNLRSGQCYPATLVTTADHDDRVVPGHSFKFAATLQEHQGCDRPALIRIETKAGHGAGKPISKVIEETADRWAFTLYNLGVTRPRP